MCTLIEEAEIDGQDLQEVLLPTPISLWYIQYRDGNRRDDLGMQSLYWVACPHTFFNCIIPSAR